MKKSVQNGVKFVQKAIFGLVSASLVVLAFVFVGGIEISNYGVAFMSLIFVTVTCSVFIGLSSHEGKDVNHVGNWVEIASVVFFGVFAMIATLILGFDAPVATYVELSGYVLIASLIFYTTTSKSYR